MSKIGASIVAMLCLACDDTGSSFGDSVEMQIWSKELELQQHLKLGRAVLTGRLLHASL